MARKSTRKRAPSPDAEGMFSGMHVVLIQDGVQARRLEIWKNKLVQMGASVEDKLSRKVSHLFATSHEAIREHVGDKQLSGFKGKILSYQWLEDSLRLGEKVSEDSYELKPELTTPEEVSDGKDSQSDEPDPKKRRSLSDPRDDSVDSKVTVTSEAKHSTASEDSFQSMSPSTNNQTANEDTLSSSNPYHPPDLNRNITEIFGKLINIYRALGDDRRSFSYYKAIPVIEKVPFKIESADQVQDLPTIGKSLKDHIQEIVTTGKLSKLEHFETDEKVKAISLFGEVWGIGPATALKLYEKGYRILEDLKNEPSLTHAQQLGLKYFKDIQTRIPRHEVQEMEQFLQKTGGGLLPGVVIVCGGSYRRGKSSCGDMDIVITHPDGKSHKGFLQKFVKRLKELNFLREDLVFSTHSEEGTDSGVDTYFGLCTYPGRELRHRIDFKVYPRDIYAFGLIAWTGNDVLNRRLRIIADSKGYRLDDTGLFLASQSSGGKRISKGRSLSLKTEKEVFDFLGFPWLEPHERNL